MFSSSCGMFPLIRSLWGAIMLALVLSSYTVSHAQRNGVNTTGTVGNEVIQGRIYFPRGHDSAMRPVVKLQSDSSPELTTVANVDGSFSFTRLRPDSYTIVVNGGDEYENAFETVTVGSAGTVPGQGNLSQLRNKEYQRAVDELTRYIVLDPKAPDSAKIRDTIKDLRSRK